MTRLSPNLNHQATLPAAHVEKYIKYIKYKLSKLGIKESCRVKLKCSLVASLVLKN